MAELLVIAGLAAAALSTLLIDSLFLQGKRRRRSIFTAPGLGIIRIWLSSIHRSSGLSVLTALATTAGLVSTIGWLVGSTPTSTHGSHRIAAWMVAALLIGGLTHWLIPLFWSKLTIRAISLDAAGDTRRTQSLAQQVSRTSAWNSSVAWLVSLLSISGLGSLFLWLHPHAPSSFAPVVLALFAGEALTSLAAQLNGDALASLSLKQVLSGAAGSTKSTRIAQTLARTQAGGEASLFMWLPVVGAVGVLSTSNMHGPSSLSHLLLVPLALAFSLTSSLAGIVAARPAAREPFEKGYLRGIVVSSLLTTVAFFGLSYWLFGDVWYRIFTPLIIGEVTGVVLSALLRPSTAAAHDTTRLPIIRAYGDRLSLVLAAVITLSLLGIDLAVCHLFSFDSLAHVSGALLLTGFVSASPLWLYVRRGCQLEQVISCVAEHPEKLDSLPSRSSTSLPSDPKVDCVMGSLGKLFPTTLSSLSLLLGVALVVSTVVKHSAQLRVGTMGIGLALVALSSAGFSVLLDRLSGLALTSPPSTLSTQPGTSTTRVHRFAARMVTRTIARHTAGTILLSLGVSSIVLLGLVPGSPLHAQLNEGIVVSYLIGVAVTGLPAVWRSSYPQPSKLQVDSEPPRIVIDEQPISRHNGDVAVTSKVWREGPATRVDGLGLRWLGATILTIATALLAFIY